MDVTVYGTGFVGSAIIRELRDRGHGVTAVSRRGRDLGIDGVTTVRGDARDGLPAGAGTDAVVVALPSSGDSGELEAGVAALLPLVAAGGIRLGVVGGSAVLPREEGGPALADTDGFPAFLRDRVAAHRRTLDLLADSSPGVDWFVLIPADEFGPHAPGERRGAYRTSRTALVADASERSAIGVEDYAAAFADELEHPTVRRGWLTVGY